MLPGAFPQLFKDGTQYIDDAERFFDRGRFVLFKKAVTVIIQMEKAAGRRVCLPKGLLKKHEDILRFIEERPSVAVGTGQQMAQLESALVMQDADEPRM